MTPAGSLGGPVRSLELVTTTRFYRLRNREVLGFTRGIAARRERAREEFGREGWRTQGANAREGPHCGPLSSPDAHPRRVLPDGFGDGTC
jgi:hypothetical protein